MTAAKSWNIPAADEKRVRLFLQHVCTAPDQFARLLNTLSMLEHIGSRKIMLSQSRGRADLSCDTLRHLAEETRHAYFFKRAAEAVARKKLSYAAEDILAGSQARLYMGRLDAFVARSVAAKAAYLYMSLLIEIRAVWFYKIAQDMFRETGQSLSLTGLLAEETTHLEEMGKQLEVMGEDWNGRLPLLAAFEQAQFSNLLTGLERSVSPPPVRQRREAALP